MLRARQRVTRALQRARRFSSAHTTSSRKERRPRTYVRAVSFLVLAAVFVFASGSPALAANIKPNSERGIEMNVRDMRAFLDSAEDKQLGHDKHGLQKEADGFYKRGWGKWKFWDKHYWRTCRVVNKLSKFMERIERMQTQRPSATLEELYTRAYALRQDILMSMPDDKRCEGFGNLGKEPASKVTSSDNTHVAMTVDFGQPSLTTVKANNQTFTRVHVPGVEEMVGTPGQPAIPMWRTLVALPQGADVKIKTNQARLGTTMRLNLVPFQHQAVDQQAPVFDGEGVPKEPPMKTFADKPFAYNAEAYRTDRTLPAEPCKVTPMGQYRDVQMAQLECTTAQYNPVSDEFRMLSGMNVEVVFEGGNGKFITSRTFSQFESSAKLSTEAAINRGDLSKYVEAIDFADLPCSGEEFLILTHPDFREAANRLADHKRARGMSTNVFNVGAGTTRDTAEEIDTFIEDRYDDCKVRPSYVMLLGDAEFIPTFYPAGMADNAGSDFPYSNYVQILFDAFFPDFGLGRVPVDTLAQANTVVDKIVDYEASPPSLGLGNGAPFYTSVGLASQFQCCRMNANGTPANSQAGTDQRAFIETSEFVRNQMVDRGYTVPRLYTRTVDNGGYCLQQNASGTCTLTQAAYSGDTTPRRYFNGTLLPGAIGAGSGFAWDADATDISAAWNDGRFLFIHRDHGWPGGWGDPGFSTGNVDALSNGDRLPVVWSINCASGLFDNETAGGTYSTTNGGVYFAERLLRKADGGAIGVIGDTRNSPTWANNALTRGFADAVWPATVPSFGGNSAKKRLGDTLNWGKVYLASQVGVTQTAGGISVDDMGYEYHIWGLTGDPTLEMWTKNPRRLNLSDKITLQQTRLGESFKYTTDGATITKLQVNREGEVKAIGRAVVVNGQASFNYYERPDPNAETFYSASLDDAVSVMLKPEVEGGTPPEVD